MVMETHQGLNGLSWVIVSHGLLDKSVINTKLLFSHLQNGNNNTYPTSGSVKFYNECKEPNLELGICLGIQGMICIFYIILLKQVILQT